MIGRTIGALVAPYLFWIKIGGVVAVLGMIGGFLLWVRSGGYDAAINEVEKQNDKAISDAELAALGLADCNAARVDGQLVRFDFRTSKCVRSSQSD